MPDPTPHTDAGDEDLRQHIQDEWTHVALIDDEGGEETRIDIDADSRAEWTDPPAENPMSLEITVTGDDGDIDLPVALVESALYRVADGGDPLSGDDFAEGVATLGAPVDQLTVAHDIQQPIID